MARQNIAIAGTASGVAVPAGYLAFETVTRKRVAVNRKRAGDGELKPFAPGSEK